MTLLERIQARCVIDANGCWIWQGAKISGYGQTRVGDGSRRRVLVHRATYQELYGPVPLELVLDHYVCDTRACANPDHVRPVTQRENILRGQSRSAVNAAKACCPRCGGPYAVDPRGGRFCPPCRIANDRTRRARIEEASG